MLSWMKLVSLPGLAYSSRYTPAAMPTGNASSTTHAAIISEPQMPWLTPALSGLELRSLVRKPVLRLSKTGIACAMTSHMRTVSTSSAPSRHNSSDTANSMPRTSRLPPVSAARTALPLDSRMEAVTATCGS
jgi:hypothetical protein